MTKQTTIVVIGALRVKLFQLLQAHLNYFDSTSPLDRLRVSILYFSNFSTETYVVVTVDFCYLVQGTH